MAKKNRTRAARRNAQRKARNEAARLIEPEDDKPVKLRYARHISQLQLLLNRNDITERQYAAGDRLYRDWRASGSEPRLVPSYLREIGIGGHNTGEDQFDARQRFELAMAAIGQRYSAVVVHVCLCDLKVSEYGRLDKADALDRLRIGLSNLSDWSEMCKRRERLDELGLDLVRV